MIDQLPPERILRETRFRLSEQHGARVTVSVDDGSTPPFAAALFDISRTGIKFRARASLRFEQRIELHVAIDAIDTDLDVAALVRWLRPLSNDEWIVGCSLEPSLPDEIVTKLAMATGTDRRHASRLAIHVEAPATWELGGPGDSAPVTLCNISTGGFGVRCDGTQEIGQRVVVHLRREDGSEIDIQGQTKWKERTSEGCVVGCAFLNRRSFEALRDYTGVEFEEEQVAAIRPRHRKPQRMRGWFVVALLLAILWPWLELPQATTATSPTASARLVDDDGAAGMDARSSANPVARGGDSHAATPPTEPAGDAAVIWEPETVFEPAAVRDSTVAEPSPDPVPQPSREDAAEEVEDDPANVAVSSDPSVSSSSSDSESNAWRTWADSSGRFEVQAMLLDHDGETVRLLKQDGTTREVGLDRLSEKDRRYLGDLAEEKK